MEGAFHQRLLSNSLSAVTEPFSPVSSPTRDCAPRHHGTSLAVRKGLQCPQVGFGQEGQKSEERRKNH